MFSEFCTDWCSCGQVWMWTLNPCANMYVALSQSEYKRGVSSWNFNVEDLKMQAAMVSFFLIDSKLLTYWIGYNIVYWKESIWYMQVYPVDIPSSYWHHVYCQAPARFKMMMIVQPPEKPRKLRKFWSRLRKVQNQPPEGQKGLQALLLSSYQQLLNHPWAENHHLKGFRSLLPFTPS